MNVTKIKLIPRDIDNSANKKITVNLKTKEDEQTSKEYATSNTELAIKYNATKNVVTKCSYYNILANRAANGDKEAKTFMKIIDIEEERKYESSK